MPKITFEREVTEDQYKMIQAATILQEKSIDDYVWTAITTQIQNDLVVDAEGTPLSQKCKKMLEAEGSKTGDGAA